MSISSARDFEKSDTVKDRFSWFMVTDAAGSVVYEQAGGNIVTLANVPAGVWVPAGNAVRIREASTAIGFLVA